LDEYTAYLTPAQLVCLQAALTGEAVGVGVEVGVVDGKLLVTAVVAGSPAAEKGLKVGDRVTRVDGQNVENVAPEAVTARLLGKPGSGVELEFVAAGEMMPQSMRLVRQSVFMPSIERLPVLPDGVGYVRILTFQDSTVQELKDAVIHLQSDGMKALVL